MFELTLELGCSVAVMLGVTAAALVLTGLFYYRAYGMLRGRQWRTLLALRAVAIVLVVLLLFRPVFSYYEELQEKPPLVFLLDTSASMSIADDSSGASRFNQARAQLEKWWDQLKGDFRLHLITFSERATPVSKISLLAGEAPDGKATSLSAALQAAAQEVPRREKPVAILLSDGIHNSARNPVDVAGKLGIVVHTVGVGASLRNNISYRDLQVTGIDCPERLLLNNKAKITGLVEGIGVGGRVVKVVLEDEGKPIQETELTLDDVEGSQRVEFEFRPTVKGRHTYTVRLPAIAEEKITENNHRSAVAMVVEPGIRVLYIEGTLRGEYGAIADRFLAKDPDLEFCSLIQTRPNVFLTRTNMEGLQLKSIPSDAETLGKFDVFIIGDLDSSYFKPQQQQLLVDRVRAGAGLVMLGGYHALGPGGYAGTPIGEILPVLLGTREIGQVDEPFLPLVTPEGVRHPIFANIAGFFPTRSGAPKDAGLPELDGCTRVERARPGASVLAVLGTGGGARGRVQGSGFRIQGSGLQRSGIEEGRSTNPEPRTLNPGPSDMPILAVQPVDKGRTAVFCGDTTRKWQQGPRALDQQSPFLQFWGQMVRWLAGRSAAVEAKASIAGSTDKGSYDPEEPVRISAVVRDERGEGTAAAKVTAKVTGPGPAEQLALSVVPGPGGHYAATLTPKVAGRHEIVVEARLGELTLTSEKLVVEVGRVNLEFEKLDMDEKMLARIAAAAKGRYYHLSTASALIDQLDRTVQQNKKLVEQPLFFPGWYWALFVGVLSVEWALRRRFQLR